MRKLTSIDALQVTAKALGKPCMLISFAWSTPGTMEDICKAAPYLYIPEDLQFILDGGGIIVCESEEQMNRFFGMTVGDEGPTPTNPYNGPCRVYALTCGADGLLRTENT